MENFPGNHPLTAKLTSTNLDINCGDMLGRLRIRWRSFASLSYSPKAKSSIPSSVMDSACIKASTSLTRSPRSHIPRRVSDFRRTSSARKRVRSRSQVLRFSARNDGNELSRSSGQTSSSSPTLCRNMRLSANTSGLHVLEHDACNKIIFGKRPSLPSPCRELSSALGPQSQGKLPSGEACFVSYSQFQSGP